ncbi:unnamed protein product, partial [Prorocentrum cordatum]
RRGAERGALRCAARPRREAAPAAVASAVVLVRVHDGTSDAMLRRHVSWARQLAAAPEAGRAPGARPFWVLADETFGGGAARRRLRSLAATAGLAECELPCLAYTEADMLAAFPVLAELRGALPDVQEVRDSFALPCRKSLAWGYHVEAILLWWLRVTGEGGGQAPPAHVWVIEDPTTPDTPALTWARSWRRTRRTARTCWRTASTRGARLDLAGRRVRGLLGAGWGPPRALRGARAAPLGRAAAGPDEVLPRGRLGLDLRARCPCPPCAC